MKPATLARLNVDEPLPALVATRITLIIATTATSVLTLSGIFRTVAVPVIMWLLVGLLALMSFHPRISDRLRTLHIAASWYVVGHVVFYDAGLNGGPGVLLVAVALVGLFYGARRALLAVAASTLLMVFAAVSEYQGWWSPGRPTPAPFVALWTVHTTVFIVLGVMIALVQAASLRRAIGATARARHFALAAERTESAVFITDRNHKIEWVNDAFVKMTGFSQEDSSGKTIFELLEGPATDPKTIAKLLEDLDKGLSTKADWVIYPRDKDPIWVHLEFRDFADGPSAVQGHTGLQTDITPSHIGFELEGVQRALSVALTEARNAREGFEALASAFAGCEAVLCVRTHQLVRGLAEPVKTHITSADRFDPAVLETQFSLAPAPETRPTQRPAIESRPGRVIPHCRVLCPIPGPFPGLLEVFLSTDSPGRSIIVDRLPDLADQLARFLAREAEQARFRAFFDHSPDALVLVDQDGQVEQFNALAAALWPSISQGHKLDLPDQLSPLLSELLSATAPSQTRSIGWRFLRADEPPRDLEASLAPMPLADGRGVLLSIRDVTERKSVERALEVALVDVREALAEREVLLKEVHHRVKNNLQIVSSLLAMQADRSTSDEARRDLEESVHRVRSMALIHQSLYGGADLARIDLSAYAKTLALDLCSALDDTAIVDVDTVATEVSVEQAIPCGLIMNELIINALKHGRSADGLCRIKVEIHREGGSIAVSVTDQGPGLPPTFNMRDMRRATSLGMRIITALTRQLGATLTPNTGPHARFTLVVPPEPTSTIRRTTRPGMAAVQ
jgi:PAS domain S-box-containing protein